MIQNALEISSLYKTYSGGVQAVKNVDLEIKQGDFFSLLGPNGAGKSTIIGIITSLVKKSSGTVKIMGFDLDSNPEQAKSMLGVVPQEINLNYFETPIQIMLNQAGYYGIPRKVAVPRAEYLLKQTALWSKRNVQSRTLSGGMKRRLMISRALINEPKVLILDEPTAGVDVEIRQDMWTFLQALNKSGTTILLTTHYLEEAESLCNKLAIINHGEIIKSGDMSDMLSELEVETMVLFLETKLTNAPKIQGVTCHLVDPQTLEIELKRDQSIDCVFKAIARLDIKVKSMRNKANRLEQLFINLIKHHKG